MKLWFRMLHYFIVTGFMPRIANFLEKSRLEFRVWPTDLDFSLHMNNGRYLTLMDFGRLDLMVRSPLWRAVKKNGWVPVVSSSLIKFRREMRAFEPFYLETLVVDWTETDVVFEHRMIFSKGVRAGEVAAYALVRAGLYDRELRQYVPVEQLMQITNTTPETKPVCFEAQNFMAAEKSLYQSERTKRASSS